MPITRGPIGILALAIVGAARPAVACFEVDTSPTPWIWFTSTTSAQVAIAGTVVESTGRSPGDFCAVGLGHSGSVITGVTALTVVDDPDPAGGPVPLAGLSFAPNGTTTSDLNGLPPPPSTWQGFHSTVSSPLAPSIDAVLVFSVTVNPGTTYADLIDELQSFGFIGLDDATAGGGLAGTNQTIEGIVGVTELPECFDDVLQPGEVCDGATDLGCSVGDVCVDCSACVLPNVANRCKSRIIRDLGNNAKRKLKCYAKAAKIGQSADLNCLADVLDLALVWLKYTQSCPQTLPSHATMQSIIDTFGLDLVPLLPVGGTPGAYKCAANKFKATSFRAVGSIKCYAKAYASNQAVDPLCLSKVDLKYNQKFTRAETPGFCDPANVGNVGPVGTRSDTFSSDIVTNIPPP